MTVRLSYVVAPRVSSDIGGRRREWLFGPAQRPHPSLASVFLADQDYLPRCQLGVPTERRK